MRTTTASVSNTKLRRVALACQGLTKTHPFGTGIDATQRALEHLGYIQIDTLAVVARAHHHTLWTRIPGYRAEYLDTLVRQKRAFEYWSHAASYLPMRDYRFALPRMIAARRGDSVFAKAEPKYMRHVRSRIDAEGPLKARDFKSAKKRRGSWWNWKPAKRALEQLFIRGELMIVARDGMEKIYDLTERVLPDYVDTSEPSLTEFADYLLRTSLTAHGFTSLKQLAHLRGGRALRQALEAAVLMKIETGEVVEIPLEEGPPIFADAQVLAGGTPRKSAVVRWLSPFDNAVIHRERVARLFDFHYRLECYVPAPKRQFGYFCLPILFGDQIVGRVDCKAHRQEQRLELIHLHIENFHAELDAFLPAFAASVTRFAAFNQCHEIDLRRVSPRAFSALIRRALATTT